MVSCESDTLPLREAENVVLWGALKEPDTVCEPLFVKVTSCELLCDGLKDAVSSMVADRDGVCDSLVVFEDVCKID